MTLFQAKVTGFLVFEINWDAINKGQLLSVVHWKKDALLHEYATMHYSYRNYVITSVRTKVPHNVIFTKNQH